MSEQDDQIFLKRFALVLTGLVIFAVLIIFSAIGLDGKVPDSENPVQAVATAERIQPVFGVRTSPAEAAASSTASSGAATAAASPGDGSEASADTMVASAGEIDGQAIYTEACQACHMAGAAGAPQLVSEQWTDRLDKGMETLVSHAINGFNAMPAKGGRMDLSDAEVEASVEYMVSQVR